MFSLVSAIYCIKRARNPRAQLLGWDVLNGPIVERGEYRDRFGDDARVVALVLPAPGYRFTKIDSHRGCGATGLWALLVREPEQLPHVGSTWRVAAMIFGTEDAAQRAAVDCQDRLARAGDERLTTDRSF